MKDDVHQAGQSFLLNACCSWQGCQRRAAWMFVVVHEGRAMRQFYFVCPEHHPKAFRPNAPPPKKVQCVTIYKEPTEPMYDDEPEAEEIDPTPPDAYDGIDQESEPGDGETEPDQGDDCQTCGGPLSDDGCCENCDMEDDHQDDDQEPEVDPLAVACWACRAEAGKKCRNYLGKGKPTCKERGTPRPTVTVPAADLFTPATEER